LTWIGSVSFLGYGFVLRSDCGSYQSDQSVQSDWSVYSCRPRPPSACSCHQSCHGVTTETLTVTNDESLCSLIGIDDCYQIFPFCWMNSSFQEKFPLKKKKICGQ
jgi:hypothetical protein